MFGDMGFYKDILEIDYDVSFFLFRYLICYLLVFYLYSYEWFYFYGKINKKKIEFYLIYND